MRPSPHSRACGCAIIACPILALGLETIPCSKKGSRLYFSISKQSKYSQRSSDLTAAAVTVHDAKDCASHRENSLNIRNHSTYSYDDVCLRSAHHLFAHRVFKRNEL
jgi:hypothetical protein